MVTIVFNESNFVTNRHNGPLQLMLAPTVLIALDGLLFLFLIHGYCQIVEYHIINLLVTGSL